MPKTWPTRVRVAGSSGSHTQPVPSIAAWVEGSARTANTASAGASMRRVTLTASVVAVLMVGLPSSAVLRRYRLLHPQDKSRQGAGRAAGGGGAGGGRGGGGRGGGRARGPGRAGGGAGGGGAGPPPAAGGP